MMPEYEILVADYDTAVLACLTDTLTSEGYRVLPCMPQALTIDVLVLLQPRLLITELRTLDHTHMLELFAQIRQQHQLDACALLATATDPRLLDAVTPQLRTFSCAALPKPYPLDKLLDYAAQACGQLQERAVGA